MDPFALQGDRKISFVSYHTRATSMNVVRARHACCGRPRNEHNLQSALQRGGKHGSFAPLFIPSCKDAPSL